MQFNYITHTQLHIDVVGSSIIIVVGVIPFHQTIFFLVQKKKEDLVLLFKSKA